MKTNNEQPMVEDFSTLLEESFAATEKFTPGQEIRARIVAVAQEWIFIDLGAKSEGLVEKAELLDAEGQCTVKPGDEITAYFQSRQNGEIRFTTRIAGPGAGLEMIETAYRNRIPVEGTVTAEVKGGFTVKVGEARAFCPFSQVGVRPPEGSTAIPGMQLKFYITEFAEKGRRIVVSHKAILEEIAQLQTQELKARLQEGQVITGTVHSIQTYGVFVDLGGVQALLPASEVGRERVADLSTLFQPGQAVEAQIIKLDWAARRITLSTKALLGDPWEHAATTYAPGTTLKGTIARLTKFGAFVTLEPGIDGLVPQSDLRADGKTSLKEGQSVEVTIRDLDLSGRRISLKLAYGMGADAGSRQYLEPDTETYNPFAALLKKK